MKTNNESPKSAKKGSYGNDEKQAPSMTTVSDKKRSVASKMVPKGHKMHPSGMSYLSPKKEERKHDGSRMSIGMGRTIPHPKGYK